MLSRIISQINHLHPNKPLVSRSPSGDLSTRHSSQTINVCLSAGDSQLAGHAGKGAVSNCVIMRAISSALLHNYLGPGSPIHSWVPLATGEHCVSRCPWVRTSPPCSASHLVCQPPARIRNSLLKHEVTFKHFSEYRIIISNVPVTA